MSDTKETLSQVIDDIIKNRANLANQVVQNKQSVEVGEAQLVKFDTLIASLQVALNMEGFMDAVAIQEAANAAASNDSSPSIPASAPPAVDAGAQTEAA